jgi:hypothetical protein
MISSSNGFRSVEKRWCCRERVSRRARGIYTASESLENTSVITLPAESFEIELNNRSHFDLMMQILEKKDIQFASRF